MKKSKLAKITTFLFLVFLSNTSDFVFSTKAGNYNNPTIYPTLHEEYKKADNPDEYGMQRIAGTIVSGYQSYFRVFIPPGTQSIYLAIYEYGGQTAIVRHKKPPTTTNIPPNYFDAASRKLSQLTASDQIISENHEGKLTIINEGIYPPVTKEQAGWLYAYITGGGYSSVYQTKWMLDVDVAAYNDWNSHSGSNPDGSINWAKDVEGVEVYVPSSPALLPGDLNQDKKVDIFDYNLFLTEFGKVAADNLADIDKSGKVDIFDYNLLLSNFGKSG